ncbi:MAG: tyrosine-type recombinase/integrase [Cyanobacteria bacterium P01_D01_bin.156]
MMHVGKAIQIVEQGGQVTPGVGVSSSLPVPAIVAQSGDAVSEKFVEYFIAQLRNPNTRDVYRQAVRQFLEWCEAKGAGQLQDITFVAISAYIEQHPGAPTTIGVHLAAIRELFNWLKQQGVLEKNPAENVRGPKYRIKEGKTPFLESQEMRQLLDSIDTSNVIGLRDRALIALMTFTFSRISATLKMDVEDYIQRGSTHLIRLHEKGGKDMGIPLHHTANEYLHAYIEAAEAQEGIVWGKGTPLFRSQQHSRVYRLSDKRLLRGNAWSMVKRRGQDANLHIDICNHSFRATGITNYLENGGSRDIAQDIAGHEDVRTTALYDRRTNKATLDEVQRMRF